MGPCGLSSCVAETKGKLMSRIERGLFRLWLVLSIIWIGVIVAAEATRLQDDIQWTIAGAVIPPMGLLMLGAALIWAIRGFRAHDVGR
jgi:hypothetical protein